MLATGLDNRKMGISGEDGLISHWNFFLHVTVRSSETKEVAVSALEMQL